MNRRDKSRKNLKNKARGMKLVLALLFTKMHCFKIMIIKTVRYWHRNKETNKRYQIESLQADLTIHMCLVCNEGGI